MAESPSISPAAPIDRAIFRRRLRRAVLLPIVVTTGLAFLLLWQLLSLAAEFRSIESSDDVMAAIPRFHSDWIEMELGLGGYSATGDPALLARHEEYRGQVAADLEELNRLAADQPEVLRVLDEIETMQAEYLTQADADIAQAAALAAAPAGQPAQQGGPSPRVHFVPQMAEKVAELTTAAQTVRQERRDSVVGLARNVVIGSLIAAVILGFGLTFFSRRQLVRVSDDYECALELVRGQGVELLRLATHDTLTGLANRRLFRERLDEALRAAADNSSKTAVLYVDLDGFKQVNDRLGHAAGDQLLIGVAQRLTMSVRPGDTIARMGGDEFTVLATDLKSDDEAESLAKAIRASLTSPFVLERNTATVGASIGIAIATGADRDAEALLRHSDGALYQAKADGKSRYVVAAG
jgi:diguanylate cyclase (GGDEF)-like protein